MTEAARREKCEAWLRSRIAVMDCPFDEDVDSLMAFAGEVEAEEQALSGKGRGA